MPNELHDYRIMYRRHEPRRWRAVCSCGWTADGTSYEDVSFKVSGHDLDFETYLDRGQFEIGARRRDKR